MKYIKTYEKVSPYKIGDYVELDNDSYTITTIGIITNIKSDVFYNGDSRVNKLVYKIHFDNNEEFFVEGRSIIRKLTPEEIEDFLMKKDVKKYNI